MWQSQVEIEHYSIMYFNHVIAFKVLWCRTFVEGRAHMCSIDVSTVCASMQRIWTLPQRKFYTTALRTRWCDRNTQRNNVRFLSRTATCVEFACWHIDRSSIELNRTVVWKQWMNYRPTCGLGKITMLPRQLHNANTNCEYNNIATIQW